MSTYIQYTGIFRKKDGSDRLMNFIKILDMPRSLVTKALRENHFSYDGKQEIVFDINVNAIRTFNHGTLIGDISSKYIKKQFDNL